MSLLSRLFGSSQTPAAQAVTHGEFRIFPDPSGESAGFRIGARIEKDFDGQTRTHIMIRADTYQSRDTAVEASVSKAKQLIDQQGDTIFR